MRKFFRKFHLWVSVPFGIVITITCFTGALLVFEDEITALCRNNVTSVTPDGEPLPLDVIAEKVEATLPGDVDITGIVIPDSSDEAYKVNLSKPKKAAVYVNQYTGEVKGGNERLPFFQTVFRLHRWLMDSNPGNGKVFWGRIIVGTSTLAFVVILISGLVIWWPRNRKMLKNRLQITFRKGKNRFWYDLHIAGGFYALLLLLVMALTGLTWSFEWYKNGVYDILGAGGNKSVAVVGKSKESAVVETLSHDSLGDSLLCVSSLSACSNDTVVMASSAAQWNVDAVSGATTVADAKYLDAEGAHTVDAVSSATAAVDAHSGATIMEESSTPSEFDSWQVAYENVKASTQQFETITVSDGTVSVQEDGCGNVRAADKYIFNKENGNIISVQLYENSPVQSKVAGWIYSLHVGDWGGFFGSLLSFLAALLGATLPLTGYYFWIRRLYGKHKSKKTVL